MPVGRDWLIDDHRDRAHQDAPETCSYLGGPLLLSLGAAWRGLQGRGNDSRIALACWAGKSQNGLERWRQFVGAGLEGSGHGDDEAAVALEDELGVDDGQPHDPLRPWREAKHMPLGGFLPFRRLRLPDV